MRVFFSALLLLLNFNAIAASKITVKDLQMLKSYMTGAFNSELQAKNDSDFYEIHLHMQPIWEKNKDEFWLYVEQAMSTAKEKPYRQRIYHVSIKNDSTIESKVYEMKSPLRFAGAYKNIKLLAQLTPDSLELREGCAIELHLANNNSFTGSTHLQDCNSALRGAKYATSEVSINSNMMVSWDRGWNAENKQVWGAVKGGYQFVKQRE
jgi:hypothetical protein